MKRKNMVAFLMTAVMMGSMLGNCVAVSAEGGADEYDLTNIEGDVTITFRSESDGETDARRLWMEDLAKEFMEENPNVTVEMDFVDNDTHRNKLKVEMAGGNPPDVFRTWGQDYSQPAAEAGMLLDITPYLDNDPEWKEGLQSVAWDIFTYDGKIMGAGTDGFVEGLFYNKKVCEELGITKLETYSDFLDAIEKAKAAGITPIAAGLKDSWSADFFAPMMLERMGGYQLYQDIIAGKASFVNDEYIAAIKLVQELAQNDAFVKDATGVSYSEAEAMLANGEALFMGDGSWAIRAFYSDSFAEGTGDNIGFVNFPSVPDGKGDPNSIIYGLSPGYAVSGKVTGEERKAAVAFFKKITCKESLEKLLAAETSILPIKGEMDLSNSSKLYREVMEKLSALGDDVVKYSPYNDTMLPGLAEIWHDVNVAMMDKTYDVEPEELLQQLDDGYAQYYK